MPEQKPKTNEEWLRESDDSPALTRIKAAIIGQLLLKDHPITFKIDNLEVEVEKK